MRRGEIYTAAAPGDYGKPRPVVVVQSDLFADIESVTVCLMTSTLIAAPFFRVRVEPGPINRLRKPSDIMIDKIMTVKRSRLKTSVGELTAQEIASVDQALARWLGLPSL